MSQLNEALKPLEWLIGRWKTFDASTFYPTMKTLEYVEEMDFLPLDGQPVLSHKTVTWNPTTQKKMHTENGFLRVDNKVTLLVSHIFGATEISEGGIEKENELTLASMDIGNMSGMNMACMKMSDLRTVKRFYKRDGDVLLCEFSIGTSNQPLQPHVIAKYRKVQE